MGKSKVISSDKKKVRIILIISIVIGLFTSIYFLIDNLDNGLSISFYIVGTSLFVGFASGIASFFAIVVSLMEKERIL